MRKMKNMRGGLEDIAEELKINAHSCRRQVASQNSSPPARFIKLDTRGGLTRAGGARGSS